MTNTNRKPHRLIVLIAAGSVALGAQTFGISTSPGSTRGAGRSAAVSNIQKTRDAQANATIRNTQALTNRKAGGGQQDYL